VTYRGQMLEVEIGLEDVGYRLREGESMVIRHETEENSAKSGTAAGRPVDQQVARIARKWVTESIPPSLCGEPPSMLGRLGPGMDKLPFRCTRGYAALLTSPAARQASIGAPLIRDLQHEELIGTEFGNSQNAGVAIRSEKTRIPQSRAEPRSRPSWRGFNMALGATEVAGDWDQGRSDEEEVPVGVLTVGARLQTPMSPSRTLDRANLRI
jgi:hypothetical protein